MPMFKNIKISSLLALCIIGTTLVITCFLIYLWATHEYRQFNAGARIIRRIFMENTKERLRERVVTAMDNVVFQRDRAHTLLRAELEQASRIAADALAKQAGSEHLGESKKDGLGSVFLQSNQTIAFAGAVEIFAHDLSTPAQWLFYLSGARRAGPSPPIEPETDPNKLFENTNHAFVVYRSKPGYDFGDLLAHVRLLPEQHMVVGAGVNPASWADHLQMEVLEHLAQVHFGKEGYIFGSTITGDSLLSNGKVTKGHGNLMDLADPDGVRIMEQQVKAAQQPGGGYLKYRWRKLTEEKPVPKLSYVMADPTWGWVIGSGEYLDSMEEAIIQHRRELESYLWSNFLKLVIPISAVVLLVFGAMLYVTRRFRIDFDRFERDFAKFAFEKKAMNPKAFWLQDLVQMAKNANRLANEHRRTEKELRVSRNVYREMIRFTPAGIFEADFQKNRMSETALLVNPWIGYSKTELKEMEISALIAPESRKKYEDLKKALLSGQKSGDTLELLIQNKKGQKRWSLFGVSRKSNSGVETVFRIIYLDIHERKMAEQALADSEIKFRTLFDLSPQPITLSDTKTRFVDLNIKACHLVGRSRSDIVGKTPVELGFMERDEMERFSATLQDQGAVSGFKKKARGSDGANRSLLLYAQYIRIHSEPYVLTIFLDVTDQEKLKAHLLQIQKLEAVGTLAGGIAHDMNNLLMVIQGNISLMKNELPEDQRFLDRIEKIESSVKSGSDLAQRLLGFARGGKYEVKQTDLNRYLSRQNKVFGRTRKEVQIHEDFEEKIWSVFVDRSQMEQVILNLYINAWQAMPEGGQLFVSTSNILLDEVQAREKSLKAGHYAKVSVEDTGMGMDESVKARIFEPFFTTKERGTGTGLGLASVFGIIQNHGGAISVQSAPGEGARFDIMLPARPESNWEVLPPAILKTEPGTETILLVDDEPMVLGVGKEMMEALGYTVLSAATPEAARELIESKTKKIQLAVLDIIMPNSGGQRVFELVQEKLPHAPVLLCSGYSAATRASDRMVKNSEGFIQKPFNLSDLSRKIRSILDQSQK